jgi:hypothetical protein
MSKVLFYTAELIFLRWKGKTKGLSIKGANNNNKQTNNNKQQQTNKQ